MGDNFRTPRRYTSDPICRGGGVHKNHHWGWVGQAVFTVVVSCLGPHPVRCLLTVPEEFPPLDHVPDGREISGRGDVLQPEEAAHVISLHFLGANGRLGQGRS